MKNYSVSAALLLFTALLHIQAFAQAASQPEVLYRRKEFFDLRDEIAKQGDGKSPAALFYRGAVANKFNRPQESIRLLETYIKNAEAEDANLPDAYELLADSYVKTYRYRKAAESYKLLLGKFKQSLGAEKAKDVENSYKIWSALGGVPPQTASFAGDTRLQATRDKARLMNVPVEINAQTMDFVFDTGANLSTVTASTARRLNLKIIETDVSIGSSTDKKVDFKLAVAPVLKIGRVTLRNVVFLVLEDRALHFPQINYQINGIVGFPVIEAFREVTLTRKDEILIPARSGKTGFEQNMCLDELNPVILGTFNNIKMSFTLDTGAQTSTFYPAFYKSQEAKIKKTAERRNVKIGGAGGLK